MEKTLQFLETTEEVLEENTMKKPHWGRFGAPIELISWFQLHSPDVLSLLWIVIQGEEVCMLKKCLSPFVASSTSKKYDCLSWHQNQFKWCPAAMPTRQLEFLISAGSFERQEGVLRSRFFLKQKSLVYRPFSVRYACKLCRGKNLAGTTEDR